ncbi:MAG TPA: protein-disulfide reductase DsbD domain-containing protein, partial [Candidatus Polarisedimenticolia bacterium]|nr:protein-disulfide reductase DsbD domain-containing protein [Candidatus Polarisedimenticolia bacterium]
TPQGNFEGGASIPHVEVPPEQFAERRKLTLPELTRRLDAGRALLLARRETRKRPHLDDKILTSWNGLMIAALADGARTLEEPRYLKAAERAADFILKNLRGPDGLLRVSHRAGQTRQEAFLDDQAFFIKGLLALHEAGKSPRWLDEARSLTKATEAAFWDPAAGGYYFAREGRGDLLVRAKNPTDGALPSGNSVMAANLIALSRLTSETSYAARAQGILSAFSGAMQSMPGAFHNMLAALSDQIAAGKLAGRKVVEASVEPFGGSVRPGGRVSVTLRIDIQDGWHINSHTPSLDYLIPTDVKLEGPSAVSLAEASLPKERMVALGFAGKPISVYEGKQAITLVLQVAPDARPGPLEATAKLTYQACNNEACQPPAAIAILIPLSIQPPG